MIVNKLKMSVEEQAEMELTNAKVAEYGNYIESIAKKVGYRIESVGKTESGSEIFEYEKTDEGANSGDYLNPIQYIKGDEAEKGKFYWYTDYDIRQECLKSGIPTNFADTEYFDVIPM